MLLFFRNIKSLWLQGCRTLGAIKETENASINLAEFHGDRVNQVRDANGLTQNRVQFADEFSNLLDKDAPYVARFMKAFPRAKIFGWSATAPGEKALSERSFLYHVANTSRFIAASMGVSREHLQNPVTTKHFHPGVAKLYFNSIVSILSEGSDQEAVAGWIDHGKPTDTNTDRFGFSNKDLNAYPALMNSQNVDYQLAADLDCKLYGAQEITELKAAIDQVLSSPTQIALSLYTLISLLDSLEGEKLQFPEQSLGQSIPLRDFLSGKISQTHLSLKRKIEYFGLDKKLFKA